MDGQQFAIDFAADDLDGNAIDFAQLIAGIAAGVELQFAIEDKDNRMGALTD